MIAELVLVASLSATLPQADRWWSRVSYLASDEMKGRDAASPEYRRAAEWVAQEMKRAGLKPAGDKGSYLQRVEFIRRKLNESESRVLLTRGGTTAPLEFGKDVIVSPASPARTPRAQVVFAGYGLRVPEAGHDDFRGMDLRGKVVLYANVAPKSIKGALLAHSRNARERAITFEQLGVAGTIAISLESDVPWERTAAQRGSPSMALKIDPDAPRNPWLAMAMSPVTGRALLSESPKAKLALEAVLKGEPVEPVALDLSIETEVSVTAEASESWNVLGVIRGANPRETVVVSSHLDHLGTNPAIAGDGLFNGAMDNASGVAALLEVADALGKAKRPARSILFAAVTAEEKGLLGSRWLASHPPAATRFVADLNMDMFMPLYPLTKLTAIGMEESDLGADVGAIAKQFGIAAEVDPEPARNRFTRSDQYSFIRRGVPSLAFKFGYEKGSAEEKATVEWNRTRYHAPSDDLSQPVDKDGAAAFCRLLTALTGRVANRATAPQWNETSFFKRFATAVVR